MEHQEQVSEVNDAEPPKYLEELHTTGAPLPSERMKRWLNDLDSAPPWQTPPQSTTPVPESIVNELSPLLAHVHAPRVDREGGELSGTETMASCFKGRAHSDVARVAECCERVCESIEHVPHEEVQCVTDEIFETLAQVLRDAASAQEQSAISFRLLVAMGKIQRLRNTPPPRALVDSLEESNLRGLFSIQDELAVILRMQAPEAAVLVHHALTYLKANLEAHHMDIEGDFTPQLNRILDAEAPLVQNYLVHLDLSEYLSAAHQGDRPRLDCIPGFIGGNSDTTIYAFQHMQDSYNTLLAGELWDCSVLPWESSAIRISEDVVGLYQQGRLAKLYRAPGEVRVADSAACERAWVEANDPALEYIYAQLSDFSADDLHSDGRVFMLMSKDDGRVDLQEMANINVPGTDGYLYRPGGPHFLPESAVEHIEALDNFERTIATSKQSFYFDRARLPLNTLHPYVLARILEHNFAYARVHGRQGQPIQEIRHEEYEQTLSPARPISSDDLVLYNLLSKLGIRKQLEESFEVDLSVLSLWEQRTLITVLHTLTRDEAPRFMELVQTLGRDGVRALVSHETDDLEAMWQVYESELSPEEIKHTFRTYGSYVTHCEVMRDFLCKEFGCQKKDEISETARSVAHEHLERGGVFLRTISNMLTGDEGVSSSRVHEILTLTQKQTDLALLNDSYREMKRLDPTLSLEKLASVSVETLDNEVVRSRPELVAQMETIYRENWSDKPEAFVAEKIKKFRARLAGTGRMYVATYEYGGTTHVLAFASVVEEGSGRNFASALNRNPALEVGDMGRVMLERIIAHESEQGILMADTEHGSRHERAYINTYGFVGTGMHVEEGVLLLDIARNNAWETQYSSNKCRTREEAQALATEAHERNPAHPSIQLATLENTTELTALFADGYMLTRIFPDGSVVCEKAPREGRDGAV